MSYVAKTLAPDERIVYRAHFHWVYDVGTVLALLVLGIVLIGIYMFFERIIRKVCTEIVVTDRRLVFKTGFVSRRTKEVSLEKIEEIQLTQSFWGRILDYGRLDVRGTGVGNIQIPTIDEPVELRRAINSARAAMQTNGG